jgi:hypothetical protein
MCRLANDNVYLRDDYYNIGYSAFDFCENVSIDCSLLDQNYCCIHTTTPQHRNLPVNKMACSKPAAVQETSAVHLQGAKQRRSVIADQQPISQAAGPINIPLSRVRESDAAAAAARHAFLTFGGESQRTFHS